MENYSNMLKELIKKLKCKNIIVSDKGSIIEIDIIKNNKRHSYIIKPNGIDTKSYDNELNTLVIKYYDMIINLAKYETNN